MTDARLLLVEDDPATAMVVARLAEQLGWRVEHCATGAAAQAALGTLGAHGTRGADQRAETTVILLDLGLPDMSGLDLIPHVRAHCPQAWIIVLTAEASVTSAVGAMRAGAHDYLAKPVDRQRLTAALTTAAAPHASQAPTPTKPSKPTAPKPTLRPPRPTTRTNPGYNIAGLVGASEAIRRVFHEVERVAPRDIPVLLHGESGTGKELLARALHDGSPRATHPFVAVNCAAIPDSLHEAELFGFEKGAFTGATQRQAGRFEQAHRGTLFLDEVAELSLGLQAKLLRALQEQRFYRVGGADELAVDVRVVAATHRDLRREVEAGRFREDLLFRLAVFEIALPPLREREGDLLLIATYMLERMERELGRTLVLNESTQRVLLGYAWPGNVRELRNCLYRAAVMTDSDGEIWPEHLPPYLASTAHQPSTPLPAAPTPPPAAPTPPPAAPTPPPAAPTPAPMSLPDQERQAIIAAIALHKGNMSLAAKTLGIGRTTLYRKLKQYGL